MTLKVETKELNKGGKRAKEKLAIVVERQDGKRLTVIVSDEQSGLEAKVYREHKEKEA